MTLDDYCTVAVAADRLKISQSRVRQLAEDGRLAKYAVDGRTVLITKASVERVAEERRREMLERTPS